MNVGNETTECEKIRHANPKRHLSPGSQSTPGWRRAKGGSGVGKVGGPDLAAHFTGSVGLPQKPQNTSLVTLILLSVFYLYLVKQALI